MSSESSFQDETMALDRRLSFTAKSASKPSASSRLLSAVGLGAEKPVVKTGNVIDIDEIDDPQVRAALAMFDYDGNGTLDEAELRRAADAHKSVLRGRKYAILALIAMFLFTVLITGALSIAVYYIVGSQKDTTIDADTGTMMVKDHEDVEVNMKSHGKAFVPDAAIRDIHTGKPKNCVSHDKATQMFKNVYEGTTVRYAETDADTNDVKVYNAGTGSSDEAATWSSTSIDMGGGVKLIPDLSCTNAMIDAGMAGEEDGDGILVEDDGSNRRRRRKLTQNNLMRRHIQLRQQAMNDIGIETPKWIEPKTEF